MMQTTTSLEYYQELEDKIKNEKAEAANSDLKQDKEKNRRDDGS